MNRKMIIVFALFISLAGIATLSEAQTAKSEGLNTRQKASSPSQPSPQAETWKG